MLTVDQPATVAPAAGGASPRHPRKATIIEPRHGWRVIDWRELIAHRDLYRFLVWRSVKVLYAQSALGIGWAIIQPLFSMIVFTVVFGYLAEVESDGAPYAVFAYTALVPWTYFANALTEGTGSLISGSGMLSKVYFPRLLLPLSIVTAKLVDFGIALTVLFGLLVFYGIVPTAGVMFVPVLVLLMVMSSSGLGMWMAALAVQYRDIKYAIAFIAQILQYCAPVVYPSSLIPAEYVVGGVTLYPRLLYAINPMVGVIEGFRSAFIGTTPMPWDLIAVSAVSSVILSVTGAMYFTKKERLFADVA